MKNNVNPDQVINVIDEFDPETTAMLQAFYSRNSQPIMDRLKEFGDKDEAKVKKALASYYIGYSHASIGDCGSTTIFIENVSHFVAKAIQDNPLYNGQESSTRYINYANQPYVVPKLGIPTHEAEIDAIIKTWFDIYHTYLPKVIAGLKQSHPINEGETLSIWEKAINARAFDIMRGFLPAASCTQLSWHTNLRQARDKLRLLVNHPVDEIRCTANTILSQLLEKYGSAFKESDSAEDQWIIKYADAHFQLEEAYFGQTRPNAFVHEYNEFSYAISDNLIPALRGAHYDIRNTYGKIRKLLETRPKYHRLPHSFSSLGTLTFDFSIDFGSWRDIQRHRNGVCPTPNLNNSVRRGIHPFYIDQVMLVLDQEERQTFIAKIEDVIDRCRTFTKTYAGLHGSECQYVWPLGIGMSCTVTYSLPEIVYVTELRTSQHVHPTLRQVAQALASYIQKTYPEIKLYVDMDEDKWSIKRGTQDIVKV